MAAMGAMLLDARRDMVDAPYLIWVPGLATFVAARSISKAGNRPLARVRFDKVRTT